MFKIQSKIHIGNYELLVYNDGFLSQASDTKYNIQNIKGDIWIIFYNFSVSTYIEIVFNTQNWKIEK